MAFSRLLERLRGSIGRGEDNYSKVFSSDKYKDLEELIGVKIKNKSFYVQALMHRSFLEYNEYDISNERLEFLGDSVLNLTVAEYLYNFFKDKDEGFLTKIRAKLVNRTALAEAAENIGLAKFLLISKNLSNTFTNGSKTVLSDALEALIGAIYLDSGLEPAKRFIVKNLVYPSAKDEEYLVDENFKSQLLEYAQANKIDIPVYTVIDEEGPQHNRIFTVRVSIGNEEYGIGKGRNKKSAEQNAAHAAMNKILNL